MTQVELKSGGRAYWLAQLWRYDGSPAIDDTLIDTDSGFNNDSSEKSSFVTGFCPYWQQAFRKALEFPVARFGNGATMEIKDLTVGELKKFFKKVRDSRGKRA